MPRRPGQARRPADQPRRVARTALAVGLVGVLAACTGGPKGTATASPSGHGLDPALLASLTPPGPDGTHVHVFGALLRADVAADPRLAPLAGLDTAVGALEDDLQNRLAAEETALVQGAPGAAAATTAPTATGAVFRVPGGGGTVVQDAARVAAADTSSGSGSLGVVAVAAVLVMNAIETPNGLYPPPVTGTQEVDGASVSGSVQMTNDHVEFTTTVEKDGVTWSRSMKVSAKGDPCPDESGKVTATIDVSLSADSGGVGGGVSLHATAVGTVADTAWLTAVDVQGQHQASLHGSSGTATAVTQISTHMEGDITNIGTPGAVTGTSTASTQMLSGIDDSGAAATQANAAKDVVGVAWGVLYGWQDRWRSGRCVKLSADLPSHVRPGSSTPFSVTAKGPHGPLSVPVTGSLASGQVSLSPDKVPSTPGTFTYVAPGEKDKKASLKLSSTSRRGIGELTQDVKTQVRMYEASGVADGVEFRGFMDEDSTTFTLFGSFPGGDGDFHYTATSPTSGTVQLGGGGSGATLSGSGRYTIADVDDTHRTLTQTVYACVDVSGICRDSTQVITLTQTN